MFKKAEQQIYMHTFSDKMIIDYEKKANLTMAFICRAMMVFLLLVVALNLLGIFIINDTIYPVLIFSAAIMFVPTILYNFLHINSIAVRYVVLTLFVIMSGILYTILSAEKQRDNRYISTRSVQTNKSPHGCVRA